MEYQTILEAIKDNQVQFISTCLARSKTTPSHLNRINHTEMAEAINTENWDKVEGLLSSSIYRGPLEGVVYCLPDYSDIEGEIWHSIVDLFENDKII